MSTRAAAPQPVAGSDRRLSALVTAVVVAALLVTVVATVVGLSEPLPSGWRLLASGLLAGAAWALPLAVWHDTDGVIHVWGDTAVLLGLAMVPGPLLVPCTAVGVHAMLLLRRRPVRKAAYNAAMSALATSAALVVFRLLDPGPVDVLRWPTAGALVCAAVTYWACCEFLADGVVSVAQRRAWLSVATDGLRTSLLVLAGDITIGLLVLFLANWRVQTLAFLPLAAWALRQAYANSLRLSAEEKAWRRLEEACRSVNRLDEQGVLDALMAGAAKLFRVDLVEVSLTDLDLLSRTVRGGRDGVVDSGTGSEVLAGEWVVAAPLRAGERAMGELRLLFTEQVVLSEQERRALSTLASAAGLALWNAWSHERTVHEAAHDALTGLANRRELLARVWGALEAGETAALLLVDLDRFKEVNDTLGHAAGDTVLVQVGQRLARCARPVDTVARLGGDEFALLLPGTSEAAAAVVADRVIRVLAEPARIGRLRMSVAGSIGIACAPGDAASVEELLRCADVAMYAAKFAGGGARRYDVDRDGRSVQRLALQPALRAALDRVDELVVCYQPQYALATGEAVGAEALARWRHPEFGALPPRVFLPVVEHGGLSARFTRYVLDRALAAQAGWARRGADVPVAVNLSARDLLDRGLPAAVQALLDRHGVPADRLVLEIPETVVLADLDLITLVLGQLHQAGVRLSLDDFGTGGAPLTLLARAPVDQVKIDRSFVARMLESATDKAIVQATIDLAHSLGLQVVAEGVQEAGQEQALRALGCDAVQGFHEDAPLSSAEIPFALQASAARAAGGQDAQIIYFHDIRRRADPPPL